MISTRLHGESLEADIGRIGREIFMRAEAAAPSIFSMEAWQQFAMNWMTQDEDLKLRLFRFIEVMPSLKDSTAIARHLEEYLKPHEGNGHGGSRSLPPLIDLALSFRRHDSAYAKLVSWAAMFACGQSAHYFISGSTPAEAIASVRRLRRKGMTFTLDVLGETIIADRVAVHHQEVYLQLIGHLGREAREWVDIPVLDHAPWGPLPKVNVSIKLSAIVVKFDSIDPDGTAQAVLERLRPIFRAAREVGAFINVDLEHYAVKDMTLDIFKRVLTEPEFRDWSDVGIVIQTYMPEAERDMRELIAWARSRGRPITVRIVKGAYWDSETANALKNRWPIPLYTEKWESDASFERVGELLLRNADAIRPAFASHNVRSIAAVLAMESALGLPPRTLELQMLTGMGDQLKRAVASMGQRLRVYAPFGDLMTGMAYLIRRLIENTANESFLRQSFGQQMPIELLLAKPGTLRTEKPALSPAVQVDDSDAGKFAEPFVESAEIDFSREENRRAMRDALVRMRLQFGRKYPAIILNGGVDTRTWHESINPSNPSEVVGRTAICDHALADRAVNAARAALPSWSAVPPVERAAVLERAADILDRRRFEMCAWMTFEVGKTWREAQGDFMETADFLRFHAREMRRLSSRPRQRDSQSEGIAYSGRPRGVVAVIGPFCSPTSLPCGMIAAALVTGNTVIFKPASDASVCGSKLCEVLIEAGLPNGVLSFLPGPGGDLGEFLARHSGVDMVAFTGSARVGRQIIEQTRSINGQGSPRHVVAEMGGNNAIIVDDDANLDDAVQATMASAFGYSGQKCTACSRVIVVGSVYSTFLDKLIDASSAIQPGSAESPATLVGPLINADAVASARRTVDAGMREARCVLPMTSSKDTTGAFHVSPVIFADVSPNAAIAREECMAPVLCVMQADSFETAVTMANTTRNALCAGVYSRSPRNIEFARHRVVAGILHVNRKITLSRVDRQPVGPFRVAGIGIKASGADYLQQFMMPASAAGITVPISSSNTEEASRAKAVAHAH